VRAKLAVAHTSGSARAGRVVTSRGGFEVPCFMPVATRGSVKALSGADVEALGAEVVLANAYHLMLRPGAEVVAKLGGIHGFASWGGHVLTDSGGYQVLSLSPEVDDAGVTFRSVYDGSQLRLSPEGAVAAQELIGADIQMVLDVCPPLESGPAELRTAVDRTASWAARAKAAHRREDQALFGIVQGGLDASLRRESARRTVEVGFDGYAVGGLSVGESREQMLRTLAVAIEELPEDAPRYLMGVGDPVGLLEAISLGIDMFDCVLPTRLARHGTVLTSTGRLNLRNAAFSLDDRPLDSLCGCFVCGRWTRAYLRHLLVVGEPAALRMLTIHNLAWVLGLVESARDAIRASALGRLCDEVRSVWAGEA
jgi:queuine tRNA-ribosyltransferase